MRVAVVTAGRRRACTLKDVAGGFGTAFRVGDSPFARLLERAKSRLVALPPVVLATLHRMLADGGADVLVGEVDRPGALPDVELCLLSSSIVDCELEREVAARARARGAHVLVFGTFAAEVPEVYAHVADGVVRGDVEALVPALLAGERPRGVVEAGFVEDLDALPLPRWDAFDVSRFRYGLVTRRGVTLPIQGGRGCAYGCDYCPYLVRSRYRTRSVESLVDEIAYLARTYGARGLSFRDPLRLFDEDEAARLADGLARADVDVRFSMEARTDRLSPAILDHLVRAGLRCLEVGIESRDRGLLEAHRRGPPGVEQQEAILAHCHRRGVRVIANFVLGLPEDTERGMRETIRYARRLNTVAVQFTVATPYPGTALYRQVADRLLGANGQRAAGLLAPADWERFDGWTSVFEHPAMSAAAIHALREHAYVGYHLRPRYLWRLVRSLVLDELADRRPRVARPLAGAGQ